MIYGFSLYKVRGFVDTNLVSKIEKKNKWNVYIFFSVINSAISPLSGKENIQFPDSPDFENSLNFRTGRDVQ